MYTEFFGLNEKPFAITPDPRYLYLSQRHADALAHLIYGISESGGFIQLTGEVGTGKTTLIRSVLEQLPEKADIALILNPQLSTKEFLQSICQELRAPPPREGTVKGLIDALNGQLLLAHASGRRVVLIVDEAQNLSTEVLEQVRLLTNLETAKHKLLQIILIGQPELRDVLARPELRQIAQRITGRYHLEPLTRQDARAYVNHRIKVAGSQARIFTPGAVRQLYRWSRGIPRLINVIADRALLAAYTKEQTTVDGRLVRRAALEVFDRRPRARGWRMAGVCAGLGGLAFAGATMWQQTVDQVSAVPGRPVAVADARIEASAAAPVSLGRPTLATLLGHAVRPGDSDVPLQDLFALWGARYDPAGGPACTQAVEQELRCLFQRGSLALLRRINRPAILSLTDDAGKDYQVVLSALDDTEAQLLWGGESFTVDVAELARYWYGDLLLLWRPFMPETKDLTPGMRDQAVRWLRESLAHIHGKPTIDTESLLYDESLEAQVREYQRERRLPVDGIVGVQTQIALSTDLNTPGTPLLMKN